jgi:hypothetical protein
MHSIYINAKFQYRLGGEKRGLKRILHKEDLQKVVLAYADFMENVSYQCVGIT